MRRAKLFFDGAGERPAGGAIGAGFVLEIEGGENMPGAKSFDFEATHVVAEYLALITGVEAASEMSVSELACFGDSELIVKQMQGNYEVKEPHLKQLYRRASSLSQEFETFAISWVPREQNREADRMSQVALDRSKALVRKSFADWKAETLATVGPNQTRLA